MKMVQHIMTLGFVALLAVSAQAQTLDVNITINTQDRKPISPLIYGINAYVFDSEWVGGEWKVGLENHAPGLNVASRRLGGNTMTSYNWESGYSNSGNDDNHSNNSYQSYITGAGAAPYAPGAAITTFHDHSLGMGAYSLLQLAAAGYVAADGNGAVSAAEAAPSGRWKEVVFDKPGSPGSLSPIPDTEDGQVYIDEEINFLMNRYGGATVANGIKAYEIDNEPGLWHHYPANGNEGTHSRLHAEMTTCIDVIDRNIALAKTVKRMDPAAEVYGPAMWGYPEFYSLWSNYDGQSHQPSDWGNYNFEPYLTNNTGDVYRYNKMTWVNVYLQHMSLASENAGRRLLDVFSFHYYPDAEAVSSNAKRMQAPRSLWDPTFTETSWITKPGNGFTDGRALQLIPKMQQSINDFYPGTPMAITEYSFGGRHHISGGIAQADALGIFGVQGVYLANYFFTVDDYIAAGFKIYRNYDGQNSTFGSTSVGCTTSDVENSSSYASLDEQGRLHIIIINKAESPINATLQINGEAYSSGNVFMFDGTGSDVRSAGSIELGEMGMTYMAPPLSVSHIVLSKATTGVEEDKLASGLSVDFAPNPFRSECTISSNSRLDASVTIVDMLGNVVRRLAADGGTARWDGTDMNDQRCASGVYTAIVESGGKTAREKIVIAR